MKKSLKILTVLAVVIIMVACISTNVLAVDVGNIVNNVSKADGGEAAKTVQNVGGEITAVVTTVGIIAAVIILMIVGIKYMMGSASEKAEYKKVMIPYIIGAVILFAASTIVKLLASWNIFE